MAARRPPRRSLTIAILTAIVAAAVSTLMSRGLARTTAGSSTAAPSARMNSAPRTTSPESRDAEAGSGAATANARNGSPGFASRQRLVEHFEKHGGEFPGLTIETYLAAAQQLRDRPVDATVLEVRRRDGVITRFDRSSGAFLAVNRDRTIRTYFRPNDGEAYFKRQASRTPGGGA
jgi:pyocin large subunit-like protein